MSNSSIPAQERWSRYWGEGVLHSLPGVFKGNYGGAFRGHWRSVFSDLHSGDRLLDIGTGNGAVALLAAEVAAENGIVLSIDAIDQASIDPVTKAREHAGELIDSICFHPQIGMETLPFDGSSFDHITGQYALEYADVEMTANSLQRVIRPGGRLSLVMHHDESVIMAGGRKTLSDAGEALDRLNFPGIVTEMIERIDQASRNGSLESLKADPGAERARQQLNQAAVRLQALLTDEPGGHFLRLLLSQSRELLSQAGKQPGIELIQRLQDLSSSLHLQRQRMADLLDCRCDAGGREQIKKSLSQAGFRSIRSGLLHDQTLGKRTLVGWWLEANSADRNSGESGSKA